MADADMLATYLMAQQRRAADPLAERRRYAAALMQQGASTAPVQSWGEGLARALQAGVGGAEAAFGEMQQENKQKNTLGVLSDLQTAATGDEFKAKVTALKDRKDVDYELLAPILGQMLSQKMQLDRAGQNADAWGKAQGGGQVIGPTPGLPQPGYGASVAPGSVSAQAIGGIESGGQPNGGYGAVGPSANAQGNRAYGKYQVLDSNIGPWTQEILGKPMTPQEFLANPQAQDKVFEAKFGEYTTKYGSPQAASRAWFAGEGGMNNPNAKDVLGTSVASYEQKFNNAVGGRAAPGATPPSVIAQPPTQMAQGDAPRGDGSGTPLATPSIASGPPEIPRPAPTPQQIQKYQAMMATGQLTMQQATQELDKEITQEWQMRRQQGMAVWQDQQTSKRQNEKAAIDLGQKAPGVFLEKRLDNYENKIRPAASAAANDIGAIHQVRQVLDAGAFTGTGAGARQAIGKLGELFGIPSEQAQNTQVLGSVLAKRVLAGSGGSLGTGFSNADRDFMENAQGGKITLDEGAIRRIMDIGERQARQTLKTHDAEAARVKKLFGMGQFGDEQFTVDVPPAYAEWNKANPLPEMQGVAKPAQPTAPAAPQAGGDVLSQARDAIAKGAPRDAVIKRLQGMGIAPDGL